MAGPRTLLASLAALLAVAATLASKGNGTAPPRRPNILLLSIDTLRADHLGSYGYPRATSPRLDRFAGEAIRYARALAPTPWTLPSHAAMLTGRHPFELGILDSDGTLPAGVPTLAGVLAGAGYLTGAFVDSAPDSFVGAKRGFDRGFDRFAHSPHKKRRRHVYDMAATVRAALEWLDTREKQRPFFLFLHTKSVHATPTEAAETDAPYDKPAPYRLRFLPEGALRFPWRDGGVFGTALLRYWNESLADGTMSKRDFRPEQMDELEALYDGGIYYTDRHFGVLLDELAARGLDRETVVVVTADHGEAFLEHDFLLHQELFEELLEVPLLVRMPMRREARTFETTVQLEDLMPTVLRLAGVAPPPGLTGRLLPGLGGPSAVAARPHFSFFRMGQARAYEAYAVEEGPLLLVHDRRGQDPAFRTVLYDQRPRPATPRGGAPGAEKALQTALVAYFRPGEPKPSGQLKMSRETIELLRSLGYTE